MKSLRSALLKEILRGFRIEVIQVDRSLKGIVLTLKLRAGSEDLTLRLGSLPPSKAVQAAELLRAAAFEMMESDRRVQ